MYTLPYAQIIPYSIVFLQSPHDPGTSKIINLKLFLHTLSSTMPHFSLACPQKIKYSHDYFQDQGPH